MAQRPIELKPPDVRICPNCSGMNWLYVEDASIKPTGYRQVKCARTDRHVRVLWIEDEDEVTPMMSQEVAA